MFDVFFHRVEAARARFNERAAAYGVGSGTLLLAGFLAGLASLPAIALGHAWIGLALLLAWRAFAFAAKGRHDGARLALGLIVLAGVPFAFALADPSRALASSFLLFAFVALAASRRIELVEEIACLLGFALACVFASSFSVIAYALGIACFVAAGIRIAAVRDGA